MPDSSNAHVPALPAMGVVTLLRALFKRPHYPIPASMPELVTEYRLDGLPLENIALYRAAFGFTGERVPLTWWYLLAQRAHLATMLEPGFPFRIAGLVHMENALEEHGTVESSQALLVRTVLRMLPPSSSGALRCALDTTGSADGAIVFSCASTYLIRRGARGGAKQPDAEAGALETRLAQWTLDGADGRRYARLSGDWNPIHLSRWSARLLGMKAPIIHGMHTLARVCALLENASGGRVSRIDCWFRAPIALGSTVSLHALPVTGLFVAAAGGVPAVTGSCTLR